MKKKKHVPILFSYRDCDDFAAYLEEQAKMGWHFKEIRMGMVFEKGKPETARYRVEVFPKRGEEDNGPTRETREYADYCEAAGWKFVGSVRKFCIFEQVNGEAVPIVTDEERLANVAKAERGILLYRWWMIPTLLVNLYSMGSVLPLLFPVAGAAGVCVLVQTVSLISWFLHWKRRLREGETLKLSGRGGWLLRLTGLELFDCLYYLFLCICLSDLNRFLQSWIAMPLIFLCMAACGIFMIVTDLFRPSDTFFGILMAVVVLAITALWGMSLGLTWQ